MNLDTLIEPVCEDTYINARPPMSLILERHHQHGNSKTSSAGLARMHEIFGTCDSLPQPSSSLSKCQVQKCSEPTFSTNHALILFVPSGALILSPPTTEKFLERNFNQFHRRGIPIIYFSPGTYILTCERGTMYTGKHGDMYWRERQSSFSVKQKQAELKRLTGLSFGLICEALREWHPDRDLVECCIETGNHELICALYKKMFNEIYE